MTDTDPTEQARRALAEKYTSPYGRKNPDWDIDGPDDDTNPYHLLRSWEERERDSCMVVFKAGDGHNSIRPLTITEVVDTLAAAGLLRTAAPT